MVAMSTTLVPEFTLGDRLAKARSIVDLTAAQMAHRLGVSRNTITNYEKGHTSPNRAVLLAYESITGVPVWWLEGDDDTGRDPRAVTQREWPQPSWFLELPKMAA